jgi:hypothetical protein
MKSLPATTLILLLTILTTITLGIHITAHMDKQPTVSAQSSLSTNVGGTIETDTTWTPANSPYIMTSDVVVPAGRTLTIEPGVVVKGKVDTELRIAGTLNAEGTETTPITFTSSIDSGGEQWSGLVFNGGTGVLRQATIRYSGNGNSVSQRSNISITNSPSVRIDQSRITNVEAHGVINNDVTDHGIFIENSTVEITSSQLVRNGNSDKDYAIYVDGNNTFLTLRENTFSNNQNNIVRIASTQWQSGKDIVLTPQTGLEGYRLEALFTIAQGDVLTVEPGTQVLGTTNGGLKIEGSLQAPGTKTQPITFTGAPRWRGIVFDGTNGEGTGYLNYSTIRNGGEPNDTKPGNIAVLNVQESSVRIENSTIANANAPGGIPDGTPDFGLYINNSLVKVNKTLFSNNGTLNNDMAVRIEGTDSDVTISRATFQNSSAGSGGLGPSGIVATNGNTTVWCSSFSINHGYNLRQSGGVVSTTLSSFLEHYVGVHQAGGGPLQAQNNWWGQASEPTIFDEAQRESADIRGNVLYEPWLTEPPDCAIRLYIPIVQR